ncbi:MAG: ATP-binding protein [Candidatus Lindowbacteria bacterium]|nr:ATP-binding protein [Candidatus Lindowbacteria bacterium]
MSGSPSVDEAGWLEQFMDEQAVTSLKLLGTIFISLGIAAQVFLRFMHTNPHGKVIGFTFLGVGILFLCVVLSPLRTKIGRKVLFSGMFALITGNLYLELLTYKQTHIQLGLFIASVCFIAFTFFPFRPWVVGVFGVLSILTVGAFCFVLDISINSLENTTFLWLSFELSSLTFITYLFRTATLNLQLQIHEASRELSAAKDQVQDIAKILARSEGQHVEYKSSLRWDANQKKANTALEQVVVKTIAGFLNSEGGTLALGVNDNGDPVGLEDDMKTLKKKDPDGYEQVIVRLVSNWIGPDVCPNVRISFVDIEDKQVCLVNVQEFHKPVYVNEKKDSVFYLRTGNQTQQLDTRRAIEYIQSHWN